jgi:hypothetical protein
MTAGQGRHGQFGPAPGARVRTPQERDAILDQQLMAVASRGGRVETRTADAAVVVTGICCRCSFAPCGCRCGSSWLLSAGSGGPLSRWTPRGVFTEIVAR